MRDQSPNIVSRRSLFSVAGGAVAGLIAGRLAKPEVARAADGDPMLLGRNNSAGTETLLLTSGGSALRGESTDDVGLMGVSSRKAGVRGVSDSGHGVVGVASA